MSKYETLTKTSSFASFDNNEMIDIFYLEAPLSFFDDLPILKHENHPLIEIDGFHTGVGFVSNSTKFYIDYVADAGIAGAFLPKVYKDGLKWNNSGTNTYGNLDNNYWTHSTFICKISKNTFNKLLALIFNDFQLKHQAYVLFEVSKSKSTHDMFNPYLRGSICDGFCFWVFNTLQTKLNITINFVTNPMQTIASIISKEFPVKLDINKPSDKAEIFNFYQMLTLSYDDSQKKLVEAVNEASKPPSNNNKIKSKTENNKYDIDAFTKTIKKNIWFARVISIFAYNKLLEKGVSSFILYTYSPDNKLEYYRVKPSGIYGTYIKAELKNKIKYSDIFSQSDARLDDSSSSHKSKSIIVLVCMIIMVMLIAVIIAYYK